MDRPEGDEENKMWLLEYVCNVAKCARRNECQNTLSGCFTCYESRCVGIHVHMSVCIMYVKHREEGIVKESRNMLSGCFTCYESTCVCMCVCLYVLCMSNTVRKELRKKVETCQMGALVG